MGYSNWDLKPRIYKAYQDGTSLVIEGANLNRWSGNIGSIQLFFEYYSYVGTNVNSLGYMLGNTDDSLLIPTREIVHTITTPSPIVSPDGLSFRIDLGIDISNLTKTFTDTYEWFGGGTKHALLHTRLDWTGLDSIVDGASSFAVLFNCWRDIDTPYSWDTHKIKRNVRLAINSGGQDPLIDYTDTVYIDYTSSSNYTKAIISEYVPNNGGLIRNYMNANTRLYGFSGQLGYGFLANDNLETTSIIQSRFYFGLARVGSSETIISLGASVPVYILAEEGVESYFNLPLPEVTNTFFDRNTSRYIIEGVGLSNRPVVAFGCGRKTSESSQPVNNFSHSVIESVTPTRIEVSLSINDLYSANAPTYATDPLENSLLTVRIGFLDRIPSSNSAILMHHSFDGVVVNQFSSYRQSNPDSSNFGKIDPLVMNGVLIEYNPTTWGDGTAQRITLWIDPVAKPNSIGFRSLENGTTTSYSQYTWATPAYLYQYEIVDIGGIEFGKISVVMPLNIYSAVNKIGWFVISASGVYGEFLVNVVPSITTRPITFDVPFIVLGDNGYYSTGESVLRGDRATLLARAVDVLGVTEHPPESPYNNTVRISDALNGWNGKVIIEPIGEDAIDIHPFTTAFLSGGEDGTDYSYEVSRFEISLKPEFNIWSGQLRIRIPVPFVLNYIEYSGWGVSIPITLTRQDKFIIPLETSDPSSCIRGQIDGNQGLRKIDFRRYVPEYLKESPFEEFVGVFEDEMNTLYTGATPSDPYATSHGILDKIDGLLDMHDPDTIPSKYLHMLAKNLGYDMVSGILRARGIQNAPDDLVRYARFLVANLPEINRIKTTKDSIRGLMFSVGALADIYYKWTSNYGTILDTNFIQHPSPERNWNESNENRLYQNGTLIENRQIKDDTMGLTPHFSVDVDLLRFDLYTQSDSIADILGRLLNTINALRPVNTVLDDLSLVLTVEHDAKQFPSLIEWWGDGIHSHTDQLDSVVVMVGDGDEEMIGSDGDTMIGN